MPTDFAAVQTARTTSARTPTISIAMCTYNGDRFLREQTESFLNQTRLPDHLVVCDDGSTDKTRVLLEEFARTAPISVELRFNTTTMGVTRNFEQAIMACKGDYIALSDQDNRWHPKKLQVLSELLAANPQAGFACSNADLIDDLGQSQHRTLWDTQKIDAQTLSRQTPDQRRDFLVQSNCLNGATMLFCRERLEKYLTPIPPSWLHDHWLGVMCEILNCTGCTTPELLTDYRLHPGQIVGIKNRGWFGHRNSAAEKTSNFLNREQRYRDLLLHLENKIIPQIPEASIWINVVHRAQKRLIERTREEKLPWWQRKWNRLCGKLRRAT